MPRSISEVLSFLTVRSVVIATLLALSCTGYVHATNNEVEPNGTPETAQDLDGNFNLGFDPNVGDKDSNTSTLIPHQTILGKGNGPTSVDIYRFTVTRPGKGIFDVDYGDVSFRPDRFGIAEQLDGSLWLKDDDSFYVMDDSGRPRFEFDLNYSSGRLHNVLAVQPGSGLFYTFNRDFRRVVVVDPVAETFMEMPELIDQQLSAMAFAADGRLFATTGRDREESLLFELDPVTGAIIGPAGTPNLRGVKGLDFNPLTGDLFAHARNVEPDLRNVLAAGENGMLWSIETRYDEFENLVIGDFLIRFDPVTGEAVEIGNTGLNRVSALAFDAAFNLFAITGADQGPSLLYQLNPATGSASLIGDTGLYGVVGMDFDPLTGEMYLYANGPDSVRLNDILASDSSGALYGVQYFRNFPYLVRIDPPPAVTVEGDDPVTAIATVIGEISLSSEALGLAFDESDNLYYLGGIGNFGGGCSGQGAGCIEDGSGDGRPGIPFEEGQITLIQISPADASTIRLIGETGLVSAAGLAWNDAADELYTHSNTVQMPGRIPNLASDPSGMLYAVGPNIGYLYRIDPVTSVATQLGFSGISRLAGLEFIGSTLYAMSGANQSPSSLYTIDPATGATLGLQGFTGVEAINSLAYDTDSDTLFGHANEANSYFDSVLAIDSNGLGFTISSSQNGTYLASLDVGTGLVERIGQLQIFGQIIALAFDELDQLYAVERRDEESFLLMMDPTDGTIIDTIGEIGFESVNGIAFEPGTGVLFGIRNLSDALIIIDPLTGVGTEIGPTGAGGQIRDIGFTSLPAATLFGVNPNTNRIYRINTATGAATEVPVSIGGNGNIGIDGLGSDLFIKGAFGNQNLHVLDTLTDALSFVTNLTQPGTLYTIDPATGAILTTLQTTPPGNVTDISWDEDTGMLYGWAGEGVDSLVVFNTLTGEVSVVDGPASAPPQPLGGPGGGDTPYQTGLAFSKDNGDLFAQGNGYLWDVDKSSGEPTPLARLLISPPALYELSLLDATPTMLAPTFETGESGNTGRVSDLAFDTASGKLYAHHVSDYEVYEIDTTTGVPTGLGNATGVYQNSGLAWSGSTFYLIRPSREFYTVDPVTGLATFAFEANFEDTGGDLLYTLSLASEEANLVPALTPELVGQTGADRIFDLTFDSTGVLYGWGGNDGRRLQVIDTFTAVATAVGENSFDNGAIGMAYEPDSDTLYMKSYSRVWVVNPATGSIYAQVEATLQEEGLYQLVLDAIGSTYIGHTMGRDDNIPDMTFLSDGTLLGFDVDDSNSVIAINTSTGRGTTQWYYEPNDPGIAFAADGTLYVKDDDDGLFTVDTTTGQGTLLNSIADLNQDNVLAIDSNGLLYTHDHTSDLQGPIYTIDPDTGLSAHFGDTGMRLGALAFKLEEGEDDQLFGITGVSDANSVLYEIDIADPSNLTKLNDTGINGIQAIAFHPETGILYGHSPDGGMLVTLAINDDLVTPIGATGVERMEDMAFSPDGRLFGWTEEPDSIVFRGICCGPSLNTFSTLVEIDIETGATTAIRDWGDFSTRLVLLDSDGETVLASADETPWAWGELGSNPTSQNGDEPEGQDAFLEYEFTETGVYYIRVESQNGSDIPVGGTYELHVSAPAELGEIIFSDGFDLIVEDL